MRHALDFVMITQTTQHPTSKVCVFSLFWGNLSTQGTEIRGKKPPPLSHAVLGVLSLSSPSNQIRYPWNLIHGSQVPPTPKRSVSMQFTFTWGALTSICNPITEGQNVCPTVGRGWFFEICSEPIWSDTL